MPVRLLAIYSLFALRQSMYKTSILLSKRWLRQVFHLIEILCGMIIS